jgi:nucleotide-binding universal stress UspA family protein
MSGYRLLAALEMGGTSPRQWVSFPVATRYALSDRVGSGGPSPTACLKPSTSKETAMPSTIVIDFNDSRRGRDALALARSLGDIAGARFVTVTSYDRDRYGMLPVQAWPLAMPEERKAAADLAKSLIAHEPGAITRVVGATSPARALHETAEREQADLIVVSSDTRGSDGRVAAGATGRPALHGAPCAVAVAPAGFAETGGGLAPVGAGFDGSWESRLALSSAAGVAESVSGELRVISAFKRPAPAPAHPMFAITSYHEHLARLYDQRWEDLIEAIDALPVHPQSRPLVIEGEPADVLVDHAGELGLLVVGSRGYGPLRRVLLGSVSDALLEHAACPVMIVPRGVQRAFGASTLHARPARSH